MRRYSISRSLMVRCFIGVSILMIGLSTGIYYTVRRGLYKELDYSVEQTASLLANQVELERGAITYEWKEGLGQNEGPVDLGFFQFWDETTGETARSPLLKDTDLPKFCGVGGRPEVRDIDLPINNRHARAIGMRIYPFILESERERMKAAGEVIDPKSRPHILVVARDAKPVHRVLMRMRWILGLGTWVTMAVVFLLMRRSIQVSLRPLDELCEQVKNRAGNRLDEGLELPERFPGELRELAEHFNELLGRVSKVRDREKDFIRHVAHELRTPIAGLRAITDLALVKERGREEYKGYLEECGRAVEEVGLLVSRLSALSKVGRQGRIDGLERTEVMEVVRKCMKGVEVDARAKGMTVEYEGEQEVWAEVDPVLLKVIWTNLWDNAVSYGEEGRAIRVRAEVEEVVRVRIMNECRLVPEDVDRLFEPLFRQETVDGTVDRHLGIGLTLSLEAAQSMGAGLRARRVGERGIEFCLEMQKRM